jgi:hypothetical protein
MLNAAEGNSFAYLDYILFAIGIKCCKEKKKTHKIIRKAVGQKLNYVSRNLKQIETLLTGNNYKNRQGYFPTKINANQIYITRENRTWYKERKIQLNGKPRGRPTEQTKERVKELKQAVGERNCAEGKFG